MKFELPENHGLSKEILKNLVYSDAESGKPALTDSQYLALQNGVARNASVLVVSPTSTGKTQIAIWALARALEEKRKAVYLVTHRALARQKFEELSAALGENFLAGNLGGICLATGDGIETGDGQIPSNPLGVPLLVATYEKFLGLLSSTGIPENMGNHVVVCDEVQLIRDPNRGRNVEILLTILRQADIHQFVGLSAVLEQRDARELAEWLKSRLIFCTDREKDLVYECVMAGGRTRLRVGRGRTGELERIGKRNASIDTVDLLQEMIASKEVPKPIIVFCMAKHRTYTIAERLAEGRRDKQDKQLNLELFESPETKAQTLLARYLPMGLAVHSADLLEEERALVERKIADGKVKVVVATSTLSAGVNFPLGTALFDSWKRWDRDSKSYVPIDSSEFHNMAGRVGRMGTQHEAGLVIYTAATAEDVSHCSAYLDVSQYPRLTPNIDPSDFDTISLQLVASNIVGSEKELKDFLAETFSAFREEDRNRLGFETWPASLREVLEKLQKDGLILWSKQGKIKATPTGRALAYTGMRPQSAVMLLGWLVEQADALLQLLQSDEEFDKRKANWLILNAVLHTPEFVEVDDIHATRPAPWPIAQVTARQPTFDLPDLMIAPEWYMNPTSTNGANLALSWIDGVALRDLEASYQDLSAGMVLEFYRNLGWACQALSQVLFASSSPDLPKELLPAVLKDSKVDRLSFLKIGAFTKGIARRLLAGLPEDVLWVTDVTGDRPYERVFRHEALRLKQQGVNTPEIAMRGDADAGKKRQAAFAGSRPTPEAKANWFRDATRNWKITQRQLAAERHKRRARRCERVDLISNYHNSTGKAFEGATEEVFNYLGIKYQKLDVKGASAAPDYLVEFSDGGEIVLELKSKEGDSLVSLNEATDVLRASELHKLKDKFCVTLCKPGVDPAVANAVISCGRLAVVEASDFGEALLRVCERALTQEQFARWLLTPGQVTIADLPFARSVAQGPAPTAQ